MQIKPSNDSIYFCCTKFMYVRPTERRRRWWWLDRRGRWVDRRGEWLGRWWCVGQRRRWLASPKSYPRLPNLPSPTAPNPPETTPIPTPTTAPRWSRSHQLLLLQHLHPVPMMTRNAQFVPLIYKFNNKAVLIRDNYMSWE